MILIAGTLVFALPQDDPRSGGATRGSSQLAELRREFVKKRTALGLALGRELRRWDRHYDRTGSPPAVSGCASGRTSAAASNDPAGGERAAARESSRPRAHIRLSLCLALKERRGRTLIRAAMVEQTRFPAQPGEQRRLLVVTPVFNEEPNLEAVAAAMAAQTRRPDRWIVVDDGSTDGTRTLLSRLEAELDFMRGLGLPRDDRRNLDGLASAREARAFNIGLASSDGPWDYVAKVDGDMVLPARYFEVLLDRFGRCPELGLAGGRYAELRQDRRWHTVSIPAHCVPGALKTYRADCLARIGGVQEQLAWDTIDEMDARRHGFATRSFPDLEARHLRATGAGAGVLRGRARHGACAWITHYPTYFVVLRALKQATFPPRVLSGAAFLWGYAAAAVRATPRVPDEDFRRHVRGELRRRLLRRPLRPVVEAAT